MFLAVLLTTAYAPLALLTGWLQTVARINPVTQVVEAARQGFVGSVTWGDTWPGYLALFGLAGDAQLLRAPRHAPDDGLTETAVGTEVRDQVLGIADQTLRGNWIEGERDGVHYGYSRPSPGHYPWQWYWDSCFHAIVWRRFDRSRAESELRSLLAGGVRGRLHRPHDLLAWPRRLAAALDLQRHLGQGAQHVDDPAAAARLGLADRGRRPGGEPRIAAHHRWLEANRDLDGDGLLWIVQPDESGLDSSPKFDPVWGLRAHARPLFPFLIARNRRLGWDARRVLDAGGPLLCEVVTNVLWCLARIAAGEPSITPRIVERLWDERRGLFLDIARGELAHEGRTDPAGRRPPHPHLDLVGARAARAPRPPGGDRQAPGRGAPARSAQVLASVPAHVGLRGGAHLRAPQVEGTASPPLLAGPDLDQLGLADLDRAAPSRIRRGGDGDGQGASATRSPISGSASSTSPTRARASAPRNSAGPR